MIVEREAHEARERRELAPYAMPSSASAGRVHAEAEHPMRTAFQRDRDRIVHSSAFRRLTYKTQVFLNHEGDHYRTRLTHSLEVAQIARTIARALGCNEDLAEALALAHDLGHTPFGHAGQDLLAEVLAAHGGFEHNQQGLRVVELLERPYRAFPGLNVTAEVREGFAKHRRAMPEGRGAPLVEAQIVDHADSIAYVHHDLDDGLRAGLLDVETLAREVELWEQAERRTRSAAGHTELGPREPEVRRREIIRALIDLTVTDLVTTTAATLAASGIDSLQKVRAAGSRLVAQSPQITRQKAALGRFLHANLYRHPRVVERTEEAKAWLRELWERFVGQPTLLAPKWQAWVAEQGRERAIADYLAGMTDRMAMEEHGAIGPARI